MDRNVAVILAGGKGVRLRDSRPKQFLKIAGKKVIEHTIEVFESHAGIDEIAVVSNPDYIKDVEAIMVSRNYSKVKKILAGGAERYDSSLTAIRSYEGKEVNLIFHDAVRPLVSHRIISDCLEALQNYNAVDVAVKTTDTIISVADKFIQKIPNRDYLYNGQTPQAFRLSTIRKAYEKALKDPDFKATDDCGVVKKYLPQEKVYVVEGEGYNMKLTYKEDIFLLDKLFQLRTVTENKKELLPKAREQLFGKVIVIFGGSYGIGKDIADLCLASGAKVYCFSRGLNDTDISKVEEVKKALRSVFEKEQKINFVINTAAILSKQSLNNLNYEEIRKSMEVNYLGAVTIAKESFPYLKLSHGGLLLYTSSSYTRGRSLYSLYSSTKAAIVNLVQALSEEWDVVKINCINPERTKTPMRVKNFGNEPEGTLLSAKQVAIASINTLFSNFSGQVIDVKL